MKKILTIVGARPQIIKAAAISRAIKNSFSHSLTEIILHTGQHYDENMSAVFFSELNIPNPNYNLNAGSASHATQTATMLMGIAEVIEKEKPDAVLIYGDTNSTLSGAIAASKLLIPVIHVEAGLRSFNKSMPEEINRIVSDHLSTLLFTPTKTGLINLEREGFNLHNSPPYHADNPKVFQCGDIMYDNSLYFSRIASQRNNFLTSLGVEANNFILCTIHRNSNTDDQNNLSNIFSALLSIAEKNNIPVVLPLHPRTTKKMESLLSTELKAKINNTKNIKIIPPASFLEMIVLETNCKLILTDSGGVQKEAFYFKKPCVILRPQTEWVELVECGAAKIADSDPETIISSAQAYLSAYLPSNEEFYGDGNAASFICEKIIQFI